MKKTFLKRWLIAAATLCLSALSLALVACGGKEACAHSDASVVSTTATCTQAGISTYECPDCGEEWSANVAALGHLWGDASDNGDGTHTRVCSRDSSHTEKVSCEYDEGTVTKAATCSAEGVRTFTCDVCGGTKSESIAKLQHKYGEGTVTKPATCSAEGVRTFTCSLCGDTKTESIAKLQHEYTSSEVAPTCIEAGYTLYACDNCDDEYRVTGGAALGHLFTGAECEERRCGRDGCHESLPAQAHKYVCVKTTPSTCTEDGTNLYRCSYCNKAVYTEINSEDLATGHTFTDNGDVEVGNETLVDGETCKYTGTKTIFCDNCGEEIESEYTVY